MAVVRYENQNFMLRLNPSDGLNAWISSISSLADQPVEVVMSDRGASGDFQESITLVDQRSFMAAIKIVEKSRKSGDILRFKLYPVAPGSPVVEESESDVTSKMVAEETERVKAVDEPLALFGENSDPAQATVRTFEGRAEAPTREEKMRVQAQLAVENARASLEDLGRKLQNSPTSQSPVDFRWQLSRGCPSQVSHAKFRRRSWK